MTFTGIVLAGGASTRMGRDKSLLQVDGRALVTIAAEALLAGGAGRVAVIGGDAAQIAGLGLETIADEHPGAGPLGGLITGLRASDDRVVMVLACDMPAIDGPSVERIVGALAAQPTALAAIPRLGERRQILTAAYRLEILPIFETAFAAGERAPRRALADVEVADVAGLDRDRLGDVDRPEDLSRYAQPGQNPASS